MPGNTKALAGKMALCDKRMRRFLDYRERHCVTHCARLMGMSAHQAFRYERLRRDFDPLAYEVAECFGKTCQDLLRRVK